MSEPHQPAANRGVRRAAGAAPIGTTIEWYDFFLFALCTQFVFPQVFFPTDDPTAGALGAYATFGVAFLARPLGALVIGALGDRRGRKAALLTTLVAMGVATFLIGVLPDYATAGIAAPLLLIALRLVQGFALGGEWGGATLIVVEQAPDRRRGWYGVFVQLGNPLGSLLANGVLQVVVWLVAPDDFLTWGWRIGFLASGLLLVVGLYIRLTVDEPEVFQPRPQVSRLAPVRELVRRRGRMFALTVVLQIGTSFGAYGLINYAGLYATRVVGVPTSWVLMGGMVGAVVSIPVFLLLGRLADRVGRRPVFTGGAVAWLLLAFPFYWLIGTGTLWGVVLAETLAWAVAFGGTYAVQSSLLAELFPTEVRYTGVALSYQLASAVWSGPIGPVAVLLVASTGSVYAVSALVAVGALITLAVLPFVPETRGRSLADA